MSSVIAESTARCSRDRAGQSDATVVAIVPATSPSSKFQDSVDNVALRTFFEDCLTIGVGAQHALDRISTDATSLERLARLSMEFEQRVQTGCLMVQALLLVRFWTLRTKQPITPNNEKIIVQWLREWYTKQSSSASNGADGGRMIQWRSLFALRLYAAMPSPHFPALLSTMVHVRISSLRLLQMRFWQDNDLPLFTTILQFVLQESISKHILEGVLQGWTRLDVPAGASTINEFAKRIEAHMKTKQTQKRLRAAEAVMAPSELSALRQLQHVQVRATPTPAIVAVPIHYFFFQPTQTILSHTSASELSHQMQMAPDFPPPFIVEPSFPHTRRSSAVRPPEEPPTESKEDTVMIDDNEDDSKRVPASPIASSQRAKPKPSSPRPSQRAKPTPSPQPSPQQKKKRNRMEESAPSIDTSASEAHEVEHPAKKLRVNRSISITAAASSPVSTASSSSPSSPSGSHANVFSRATLPIAFAHPLNDALPFHPIVASHLKEFGLAIVEPCFREHTAWLADLNAPLLQHASFQHAYRMTLGCFNDGSRRADGKPKPPPLHNGVYPSPPLLADEVFAFLEAQWLHMVQVSSRPATDRAVELPQPPAAATDCLYLKDLSVEHQVRPRRRAAAASATGTSFFPKWDKKLLEEQERCDALAAVASLCGTDVTSSASLTSDGDVEMKDVETVPKHTFPALFMDAYADHPASLLRLTNDRCEGVHNAYAYLKFGFQFFNLHIEQWLLPFVHHQLSGESTWILVPHTERHKLSTVVQQMARVRRMFLSDGKGENVPSFCPLSPVLLYSKSLLPPLSLLDEHGIKYHRIQLRGGQVLVAHGGFAHFGFSTGAGETHAFACNIMSEEWLISGGPQFVVQFFEWMLDLSDLEANQVTNELIAYGMQQHQLADALNVCPPAYSCSLLRSLRDDLQRYVSTKEGGTGSMPRGNYSLPLDHARTALSALDTAWNLLHHPHLRAFLQRVYVDATDDQSQLCECPDVAPAPRIDELSESTVKGFYAAMERHHNLVVGSGSSGSPLPARRRSPPVTEATAAVAIEVVETEAKQKEMPISQTFGSATAMPMLRLLDFLSNDARVPRSLRLSKSSHFLDIGSGIGQVVLHVQLRFALASSTGIEYVLDRFDAGETTLKYLRNAMATTTTNYPQSLYDLTALRPALDDRVNRIKFIHDRIEKHLDLLTDATHVFMFDAAFHPGTHGAILPLLCVGHSRIVVTCLSPTRLLRAWPSNDENGVPSIEEIRRMYRLLTQLSLTLAGSNSTREVYVYATCSR